MEEILCKINKVGWGYKSYLNLVKNVFVIYFLLLMIFVSNSYAQGETLSIWLWDSNNKKRADIKVEDLLDLYVWMNVGDEQVTGVSFYLTFDDKYFEVINLEGNEDEIKPFDFRGGLFEGAVSNNQTHGDPGNVIPGFQLDGGAVRGNNWVTGQGKIARFQLRAINKVENTKITIDYDRGYHRDTRYQEYPLGTKEFTYRHSFDVSIEGIGVGGIPDVLLLPGETDDKTVLNDYIINPPEDLSTLQWTYSTTADSIIININSNTSRVTYSSISGWLGRANVIFTVTDPFGINGYDSVSVAVTDPPEIVNLPEEIIFPEDSKYETLNLNLLVNDLDDPPDSIIWNVSSLSENLFVELLSEERKISIIGKKDWFGNGSVMFFTKDPNGAKDSLVVPVIVTAVNDAPVITDMPDKIFIRPTKIDTFIVLNNYVYDVDNSTYTLNWSFTGNDQIGVNIEPGNNLARLTPTTGFMGTEEIIFTVSDGSLQASDTIKITIGNEPPVVSGLPDVVINTDSLIHFYVNLNDYVSDDEPVGLLAWTVFGDNIAKVLIDQNKNATFNLADKNLWGVQSVLFTATDVDGAKGSDSITVVILNGDIPTVWGIPDIFIPVGESDSSIYLDDYVWDKDTPIDKITWSYSGGQNISVSIDSLTHDVIISSTDLNFVGTNNLTFRATDPEGNFREDVIIVNILPGQGIPFIKNIPGVKITKATTDTRILDEYLVIYPDSLKKDIKWEVFGSMDKVTVQINQQTNVATFGIGSDPNYIGEVSFRFTATNIVTNESGSRNVLVEVLRGNTPVLGNIPDITLISGTVDSSIFLDPYVRDNDTPVESMTWSVSGNVNVTVDDSRLGIGKDHRLIIESKPNFIGKEILIIKVIDPVNYSDSDTIIVNVISLTELQLYSFPNPIAGEYVNFIVYSTDSLMRIPSFKINIDDIIYDRELSRIPNLYAWRTDFQFPTDLSGTASVTVNAEDRYKRILEAKKNIVFGTYTSKVALNLGDNTVSLSLRKGSFGSEKTIVMIKENLQDIAWSKKEVESDLKNDMRFIVGYNFGPTEAVLEKPALLSFNLQNIPNEYIDKIGIFRGDFYSDKVEYISQLLEKNETIQIDKLGRYFVAIDIEPPVLNFKDIRAEGNRLIIITEYSENGSGISLNTLNITIDGIQFNGFYDANSKNIEIPVDWNRFADGKHIIEVQISDKIGNISKVVSSEFETEEINVPKSYKLEQNYPNPFNPETTIKYQIAEAGNVNIVIYSILGQKIRTVLDEFKSAGNYTIKWDGKNDYGVLSSSGIYLCVMESGNFKDYIKMIFLK